jgi:hypothetical protein
MGMLPIEKAVGSLVSRRDSAKRLPSQPPHCHLARPAAFPYNSIDLLKRNDLRDLIPN